MDMKLKRGLSDSRMFGSTFIYNKAFQLFIRQSFFITLHLEQSFFITLHLEQSFSPLFISNKNIWPLRLLFPLAFPLPPLLRPLPTPAGTRFTSLDTPAFRLPTNRHGQTGQPARTHDR